MRSLHPNSPNEIFVASGEYRYWRDDVPLKIVEKWTIHELKGGAFLYRVDENGRDEDGLSILSEALINPERQFERFNVQSYNPKDSDLKDYKADYTFNPDYVQIGRRIQVGEHEYAEFPLMEGVLVYIKQMLFMGLTISQIEAKGGQSQVLLRSCWEIRIAKSRKSLLKSLTQKHSQLVSARLKRGNFKLRTMCFTGWMNTISR